MTLPSPPPRTFENVNLLRAFAALAVVVYHVIEHSHWTAFPVEGPLLVFRTGWMGVDLFFVISGFVIAYSALALYERDPPAFRAQYWRRRLTRILPLYLLTLVLWIAMKASEFFAQPATGWLWQLFTHLAFIHAWWPDTHGAIDGANWTLAVEMQFYLAVSLLVPWIRRTPAWIILLCATAVAWAWRATMYVLYAHVDFGLEFIRVSQLPGSLDEFAAGIVLAKLVLDRRIERIPGWAWVVGASMLGYVVFSLFWSHSLYWDVPAMVVFWRTGFAAFLACMVAAAVCLPQALARRWLRPVDYLGDVSYGIYLWHLFAVEVVIHMLGINGLHALAAVLVLTIAAASISWRWFEKPFMALGRRPASAGKKTPPAGGVVSDSPKAAST